MGGFLFECPRCHNKDINKIGFLNGKPYCRNCILLRGETVDYKKNECHEFKYELNYNLSKEQAFISNEIIESYKSGKNCLIKAVCGSGKTEIVLGIISYVLSFGGRVGFAIPRREVTIEICDRLKSIFPKNKVISVYGGHTSVLEGDIICLTTHQLFRYEHYFDLLVLDEIDAFPFVNNDLLNEMFFRSIRGHYVMMSATPNDKIIKFFKDNNDVIFELNARFHHHPLPVPKVIIRKSIFKHIELIKQVKRLLKLKKQVFVFTPTIDKSESVAKLLALFIKKVKCINSKSDNKQALIDKFRKHGIDVFVCTAILERGVTFKDLQVIVFESDNNIYNAATLVQISGRVGRKKDAPDGEVIYIASEFTKEMAKSISDIKSVNKDLQDMLREDREQ